MKHIISILAGMLIVALSAGIAALLTIIPVAIANMFFSFVIGVIFTLFALFFLWALGKVVLTVFFGSWD